ncbi:hypothetical protein [Burkholderia sp. Ac-20345]|uniref:hypothetical protein n=1 Tax=Burkholderia sp. Ac-20345 TaxID=2703891 RepID=UPI00197C1324|nr:hypothetical protein [Burkholderia sp. Ac-20345]
MIVQQCVPLAITISSLAASASLAFSGVAPLWGSPGNITTDAIWSVVHFVAYFIASGNEDVANIGLLQAPIALITYLLINTVPLAIGCLAIDVWMLRQEKPRTNGTSTSTTP